MQLCAGLCQYLKLTIVAYISLGVLLCTVKIEAVSEKASRYY